MYQLNSKSYKVYGDISGEDQTYTFTEQQQLLGFQSYQTQNGLSSVGIISMFTSAELCVPDTPTQITTTFATPNNQITLAVAITVIITVAIVLCA